jgi:integrase/recombinase XerD
MQHKNGYVAFRSEGNQPMNDLVTIAKAVPATVPVVAQTKAQSDEQLIHVWLHSGKRRSDHTRQAYRLNVELFRTFAGKPLRQVMLEDLVAFQQELENSPYAVSSQRRILSAVRSLLTFGQKVGYLDFNVGAAIELPEGENQLAQRILSEEQVLRMIALEKDRRNQLVIRLLYAAGLRVSELCGLRGRHLQERGDAGQISVHGKGNKTRVILLRPETWQALQALQAGEEAPLFRSRKGGPLSRAQVFRLVKAAAKRAGLSTEVSPHWLRHAHASHALERGAPISLVKATLGHSNIATTDRYTHARPSDSSARYLPV